MNQSLRFEGSSDETRLSEGQYIQRKRKRNRSAAPFRSIRGVSLHAVVVAMMTITYYCNHVGTAWRRLLVPTNTKGTFTNIVAHCLVIPQATSMMTTKSTRGLSHQNRRRRSRMQDQRSPLPVCVPRPRNHCWHVAPLDVATFAFAEMSSSSSSVAISPGGAIVGSGSAAAVWGRTVEEHIIRCQRTGRVVCERVVDLEVPEGRCVGYAVPMSPDNNNDSSGDDDVDSTDGSEPFESRHEGDDWSHSLASLLALQSPRHWIREYLHPQEVEYGMDQKSGIGRTSFLLGRLALRQALEAVTRSSGDGASSSSSLTTVPFRDSSPIFADCVLLKDVHGRPNIPHGFLGSVSHKKNVAVALVAREGNNRDSLNRATNPSQPPPQPDPSRQTTVAPATRGIGVDLETAAPRNKMSISRKVLTAEEIDGLGNVPGLGVEEEVLLRFSLKESLYKAMHPLICQYVGFQEATVQPLADGDVVSTMNLRSGAHKRFGEVTSHWTRLGGYFLSTSSVSLPVGMKGIDKS